MRKKIEWKWEKLDDNTSRVKVIGGWLVKHWQEANGTKEWALSESMTFVSDRDHEWHIAEAFDPSTPGKLHPSAVKASDFEVSVHGSEKAV